MPRYFYNLTNGLRTVVDADRVHLEDEQAMRLEAVEMVADLRKESHISGTDWGGWRLIVYDENGREWHQSTKPTKHRSPQRMSGSLSLELHFKTMSKLLSMVSAQ